MSERVTILLDAARKGDDRALARLISLVEDRDDSWREIMREVYPLTGSSCVIGVTGSPGAGKSTLVGILAGHLQERGHTLGIIAVDPTSPYSGGALLGDRLRMRDISLLDGVFIRSMATRGALGGLCQAARDTARIMDACGRDVIVIETVGVGQDEIDVVSVSDWVILVNFPGQGDGIQAIKAGVMEIADIFVVNKADREGAREMVSTIEAMLDLAAPARACRPPVLSTSCVTGEGVLSLAETVCDLIRRRKAMPRTDRDRVEREVFGLMEAEIMELVRRLAAHNGTFDTEVQAVLDGRTDPYRAASRLLERLGISASGLKGGKGELHG
ncbi:MAG TPA: methylmalonyl Co-A mutase-associated GTPase MeaB [Deltaproteobacteria bacterium]|nr:methylmalonyl Co-A mutase-associated GTPase MeaB [Deltaproteobacteria bacterium]